MTSIGRGRGWGKNSTESCDDLRRPGKQVTPVVIENDDWYDRISKLDVNDIKFIKTSMGSITNLFVRETTDEDIEHLEKLVELALDDRTFAFKLILTFANCNNFMGPVQKIYERRDELKKNPIRFLNMVYILGETVYRSSRGSWLHFWQLPVIVCCKMLLEIAGEEEIEMAVTQIATHGKSLLLRSENFLDLILYAREVLTTRNLSTRSRCMLLLMIDLYNQKFMPLPSELQKFYVDQLGQTTLLEMQRENKNLLVVTSPENSLERCNTEPNMLMQVPPRAKKNLIKNSSPRGKSGGRPMVATPRAIRGSGASENNDQKHRNSDASQRTHRNESIKGYGHDDRFSKDY